MDPTVRYTSNFIKTVMLIPPRVDLFEALVGLRQDVKQLETGHLIVHI